MLRVVVTVSVLALSVCVAGRAAAAEPAAAGRVKQRGTVVVISDITGSRANDSKVRAQLYEAARARGWHAKPRADVSAAAKAVDGYEGGAIVTDVAHLQRLRAELGADMLVRVSAEPAEGARVTVRVTMVLEGNSTEKTYEGTSSDPAAPLPLAFTELLDEVTPAEPEPEPEPAPPPDPGPAPGETRVVHRGIAPPPEQPTGRDAVKRAWAKRGGALVSYEARGMVTGYSLPDVGFSDVNPQNGNTETGFDTLNGIGGGFGVRVGLLVADLPESAASGGPWLGFRLGVGVDASLLYAQPPTGYVYREAASGQVDRDVERDDRVLFVPTVPGQLGISLGFGGHSSPTIWRGTVFGLAWAPAAIYTLEVGEEDGTDGDWDFNPAGFEVSLDIASIEARLDGTSAQPQLKVFAFVLPPVDDLPLMVSAGLGSVWY